MSKRSDRREADRAARKLASQAQKAMAVAAMPISSALYSTAPAIQTAPAAEPTCEPTFLPMNSEIPTIGNTLSAVLQFEALYDHPTEPPAPSAAQQTANRANAQFSTGPTTPEGKATVSQNRRFHGLTGAFALLPHENSAEFQTLAHSIFDEHQPETGTEERLAHAAIHHYWLMQRALHFQQEIILQTNSGDQSGEKRLGLYLRYQTTHERSYYKALRELQNLKKQKDKQQIGFESQNAKNESLEAKTRLAHARAATLEIDTAVKKVMEAPIPGTTNISFEELAQACSRAISNVVFHKQFETAA